MRCPDCGAGIPEYVVFCDHCGGRVQAPLEGHEGRERFLEDVGPRVASTYQRGEKYSFLTFDNGLIMYVYWSPGRYGGPGISLVHFALVFDREGKLLKQTAEQAGAWWKVFRGFKRVDHVGPTSGSLLYLDMEKIALRIGAGRWGVPALEVHRWRKREGFPQAPEWRAMARLPFRFWRAHGRQVAGELDPIATTLTALMKTSGQGGIVEAPSPP